METLSGSTAGLHYESKRGKERGGKAEDRKFLGLIVSTRKARSKLCSCPQALQPAERSVRGIINRTAGREHTSDGCGTAELPARMEELLPPRRYAPRFPTTRCMDSSPTTECPPQTVEEGRQSFVNYALGSL